MSSQILRSSPWVRRTKGGGIAVAWLITLLLAVTTAIVVANEPLLQFTDCEIVNLSDPACRRRSIEFYGSYLGTLAALPIAVCTLALIVRSPAASLAASTVIGVLLFQEIFMLYFLPVFLLAALLTAYQFSVARRYSPRTG